MFTANVSEKYKSNSRLFIKEVKLQATIECSACTISQNVYSHVHSVFLYKDHPLS